MIVDSEFIYFKQSSNLQNNVFMNKDYFTYYLKVGATVLRIYRLFSIVHKS